MKTAYKSRNNPYYRRRVLLVATLVLTVAGFTAWDHVQYRHQAAEAESANQLTQEEIEASDTLTLASDGLERLSVRDSVSRSGYSREQFSPGWATIQGCDMRNRILQRDLSDVELDEDGCTVLSGVLEKGPFTGERIPFERGQETSHDIHIEHIVAVSDAWRKGAQDLSYEERHEFFNDPLNLIAIDGPINMEKGDADASEWMPPHEEYHCRYIARQIAIKLEYDLWVTRSEQEAMQRTLQTCPLQVLPITDPVE